MLKHVVVPTWGVEGYAQGFLDWLGIVGVCWERAFDKLKEVFLKEQSIIWASNAAAVEGYGCLLSKEHCAGDDYWQSFACGFGYAMVQDLDLYGLQDALKTMAREGIKNKLVCLMDATTFATGLSFTGASDEDIVHQAFLCFAGLDIGTEDLREAYPIANRQHRPACTAQKCAKPPPHPQLPEHAPTAT